MPDYSRIIDAETWAFIEATVASYPPETASRDIAEQRAIYDAMCRRFHAGRPDPVNVSDALVAGVSTRRYSVGGRGPAVVYAHGGGFVVGGLESHDDVCAEICAHTGLDVVSVDYRLAPEHPHPAAFHDCQAVVLAVASAGRGVLLCGDSAGGNLMAAVSHANRGSGILGQVLIYPGLGGDMATGSYLRHANAPLLSRDEISFITGVRGAPADARDATYAPLWDSDFSGLPPTITIAAECDPLADDARLYRDCIHAAGGAAVCIEEPGLVHGYLRGRRTVRRAGDSFQRVVSGLAGLADGTPLAEIQL